jgi:hypothetical protein
MSNNPPPPTIKPLPPGETIGGQGRAYWAEKYFQWLFPLIYEAEEREANENDQQYGLVWFARGNYIRGFEDLKEPVNEHYQLPFNTYFMVPMLKYIAHEGDNDGSNYGQLLNVVRSLSDWSPIHLLSISWSDANGIAGQFSCTRQDNGSFDVEGDHSPLEYYAETREFYLSTKGYEQPLNRAVAAGYYVIFKIDQVPGVKHKIRVHAVLDYHWAQRHERLDVTDTYTVEVIANHDSRYTDVDYQTKVQGINFP